MKIESNDTLIGRVVFEKKPLLVQDIETDPKISRPNDPKQGSTSFLSMPCIEGLKRGSAQCEECGVPLAVSKGKPVTFERKGAMDPGRPEKVVTYPYKEERAEMNGTASSVSIYIQDTGCGIPKESKKEIFSPYFTGKKHGTGLELSVVNIIAEKHRGKIEVESEIGGGTTFAVTLPITK